MTTDSEADQGRVAIVTGGGRGAGRAIARALGQAGFRVAVIGRTLSVLEEAVEPLGPSGLAIAADLTVPDEVRAAFARVAAQWGGLNVLVNNAAAYEPFLVEEATDTQILDVVNGTLVAPIYCMREAIPLMRARGGGDIVNISSQSADIPQPYLVIYGASKAGQEAVAEGLRYELRGDGFRIITVQVGTIAGTLPPTGWPDGIVDRMLAAFDRAGVAKYFDSPGIPPEEIAASIVHAVTAPRNAIHQIIQMRGPPS